MSFRKPITTLGGLHWWTNIQQNTYFIMQEHLSRPPIWPYQYRILLRENRMEIANANDFSEINQDWLYLQDHGIPQIEDKIDIIGDIRSLDWTAIINTIIRLS